MAQPIYSKPIVTKSDVRSGYLTRYFVRPAIEKDFITEVDHIQFHTLKRNHRFICIALKWKIVGKKHTTLTKDNIERFGTVDYNKRSVKKADLTFGGLTRYISNYEEFWVQEE